MEVSVSNDMLGDALASHLSDATGGMLDMVVGGIFALDTAGNKFPITGIVIEASQKAPQLPAPVQVATGRGGFLKLATFEGHNL